MFGAIVTRCCYALAQHPAHDVTVDSLRVGGVLESRLVRKGNLVQPLENVEALSLAAVKPLRCVVVRVHEARDEELPTRHVCDGTPGPEVERGELGGDLVREDASFERGYLARGVDDEQRILEDGQTVEGGGVDDDAVEGVRSVRCSHLARLLPISCHLLKMCILTCSLSIPLQSNPTDEM